MNPTILTRSGQIFNLLDPKSENVVIEDIAHALSNVCRFTGHTSRFYSVAEHSLYTSYLVPSKFALETLLHDASEAYLGDVSSPLKALLPEYRKLESEVEAVIRFCFNLDDSEACHLAIKEADRRMFKTEKRDLMPPDGVVWYPELAVAGVNLKHPHLMVREDFLRRFYELVRDRNEQDSSTQSSTQQPEADSH